MLLIIKKTHTKETGNILFILTKIIYSIVALYEIINLVTFIINNNIFLFYFCYKVVYGRFGMTTQYRCSVLHHNANPTWCDEAKLRLPATITASHHLLFTFYHISCDLTKKNDVNVETCIG